MADAQNGQISHIVSGAQVVANIVPGRTWIVDDELVLKFMLSALIRQEATWASRSEQWRGGVLDHSGDLIGRAFAWAWRTDPDAIFMRAITDYAAVLTEATGRAITLQDIQLGMSRGLATLLARSEVTSALTYAEQHWDEWALPTSNGLPPGA